MMEYSIGYRRENYVFVSVRILYPRLYISGRPHIDKSQDSYLKAGCVAQHRYSSNMCEALPLIPTPPPPSTHEKNNFLRLNIA